ncbi:MAG: hypothetical protein Kow0077_16710 [Anaerolineae bacterium]
MKRSGIAAIVVLMALSMAALACNLPIGVPRGTPTLAPTHTPSHTPVRTPTAVVLRVTLVPTTAIPPTSTPTLPPTAARTPTATQIVPTATLQSIPHTSTPRPTRTRVPAAASPTLLPTPTPLPSVTPLPRTVESVLAPTRPVTPVITPVQDLGILPTSTPLPATPTLIPTPTPVNIPPPAGAALVPTRLPVLEVTISVSGSAGVPPLDAGGGALVIDPRTLRVMPASGGGQAVDVAFGPGGQVAAAEQEDPAHPGYGLVLRVGGEQLTGSPLPSETIRFTRVRWAPDGRAVAFIAETPDARGDGSQRIGDTPSDGLWVWTLTPGGATQFTHHALHNRYAYIYGQDEARIVRDFAWSPDGTRLLVQLDREGGFPGYLGLITPDWDAEADPAIIRHENGSWSLDGRRILVSGMQTDVGPVLGWVDPANLALSVLLDGTAAGLWMQAAVELSDGRIAFVGAPYAGARPQSGYALYLFSGGELRQVASLGGQPEEVIWNRNRTSAIIRLTDGRTVVALVDGSLRDVSGAVGRARVDWAE